MFANGTTNDEVYAYIVKIQFEISYGVLDPIIRKLHKKSTLLPVPASIVLILKPLVKHIKLSTTSPRQPATLRQPAISSKQQVVPIVSSTISQIPQQNNMIPQTQISTQFQSPLTPTKNYKSPLNVPNIASPRMNMQV
jgi:hypothetical protein